MMKKIDSVFMSKSPLVSIIIPCRDEEKYIGQCLDSIIAQDYPKDRLEVLVVDGISSGYYTAKKREVIFLTGTYHKKA